MKIKPNSKAMHTYLQQSQDHQLQLYAREGQARGVAEDLEQHVGRMVRSGRLA